MRYTFTTVQSWTWVESIHMGHVGLGHKIVQFRWVWLGPLINSAKSVIYGTGA